MGSEIVVKAESVNGEKLIAETCYVCAECECMSFKDRARCPACGCFNTMRETVRDAVRIRPMYQAPPDFRDLTPAAPGQERIGQFQTAGHGESELVSIAQVDATEIRLGSGQEALDFVLGGGIYLPSVILIGGDPGSGKSTLLTQIVANVAKTEVAYYGCGEESVKAVAVRAKRLGARPENFKARQGVSLRNFLNDVRALKAHGLKVAVLDSLQTFVDETVEGGRPGSTSMVIPIAEKVHKIAHELEIAIFIVCHVNKAGDFAGPNTVDHQVDCNLMLTKSEDEQRILTSDKNRNGATSVAGIFAMKGDGLYSIG